MYPALQRLELNGWIEGEWGLSANKRRARFYKLTPDSSKHLAAESAPLPPGHRSWCPTSWGSPKQPEDLCTPIRIGSVFDAVYGIG